MPFIAPIKTDFSKQKYVNAKGNAECAEFVQQAAKAPSTPNWVKGPKVDAIPPGCLPPGTAIATFDDKGRYPSDLKGRHAAIYSGHGKEGIAVFDQWKKQGEVKPRTIRYMPSDAKNYSRSNDADTFYVIVGSKTEAESYSAEILKCGEQLKAKAGQ